MTKVTIVNRKNINVYRSTSLSKGNKNRGIDSNTVTSDGCNNSESASRIADAKQGFPNKEIGNNK